MAKVVVEYDTVTKAMSCTLDGEEVPGIHQVVFAKYDRDYRCEIMQASEDRDNDLRRYTHVSALHKAIGEYLAR